jgi:hypothetical protein
VHFKNRSTLKDNELAMVTSTGQIIFREEEMPSLSAFCEAGSSWEAR